MKREEFLGGVRMDRLYEAGLYGVWLVNQELYNIHDLLDCRPGSIIRVKDIHNSVKFLPNESADMLLGCVAGWLCDDEGGECSSKKDTSGASNG